ncbi:SLAP domain-containing protein [Lactobacillus apis]|uniref:SLAP domain-containing protein n=1 Tax=Lactobacillus apis TaxID=303541 RepID=UPI003C6D6F8B
MKHNAYLYNRYGNRTKAKIKKNRLVKTYGAPIRIKNKEYYIVNVNSFIKKATL